MLRRNSLHIIKKLHIVLTIVLALSLLVVIQCGHTKRNINEDAHATNKDKVDTVVIYDTITEYDIKYKYRLVKDTIYLEKEDEPFLLLVQKHFQNLGCYDIWVSGVEPLSVDSINVYPKTEVRCITQTRTIQDSKGTDFFGSVGLGRFRDSYMSNVGMYAVTNRKWLYGAEIGLINDKWYVGAKLGFKINNK